MPTARCSACTARCTSRTIRSTTRSTTSRPATWASAASTRVSAASAALVCWDQWYPEAARLAALGGAQMLFYPDGHRLAPAEKAEYGAAQHDAWRTIQRSHAIANGVYVAAVNRVGYEGPPEHGLEFWGGSFVADPFGVVLAEALARQGRNPDRRVRPAPHRGRPPQLAVPARPPHRRLRADSEAGDRLKSGTPRALGFRMPAEWEPHEATWIAWPHNRDDWPGRFAPIPWVYGEIVRKLSAVERVRILVEGPALERQARAILRKVGARMDAIEFFHCPTDRVWTRDFGPLFVKNRQRRTGRHRVALQRLGQVRRLALRRKGAGVRLESPRHSPVRAGHGARRRQHRRQRRRASADHRRMPAQPRAGAQPRHEARRGGAQAVRLTWVCAR